MHVYLVGFMGSGKSSCGRRLATLMDRSFVDLDDEIARRAGSDIAGIFDREGEEGFRRREERALSDVASGPSAVVATGGGVVTREPNLGLMERTGVVVWLDVPFPVLTGRLESDGDSIRPLFPDPETGRALYERRRQVYGLAGIRVRLDGSETPDEVATRVYDLTEGQRCDT